MKPEEEKGAKLLFFLKDSIVIFPEYLFLNTRWVGEERSLPMPEAFRVTILISFLQKVPFFHDLLKMASPVPVKLSEIFSQLQQRFGKFCCEYGFSSEVDYYLVPKNMRYNYAM